MTFHPPESVDYTFTEWIDSTADLQIRAYGRDPAALQGEEESEFLRWNTLATVAEMMEFLKECPTWKPWSTSTDINRAAAIGELVDALHFIGNLLRMMRVSGKELTSRYQAKQIRNAERMAVGYDGVTDKCPGCKRDLPEVGTHITENHARQCYEKRCAGCDQIVSIEGYDTAQRGG